jgi:hypothetical protein
MSSLAKFRAGQLGSERAGQRRAAFGSHGRADHLERDGGGREAIAGGLGDLQRRADDAVAAEI